MKEKICNICGKKVKKLTYKHIPPQALGNSGRMNTISSDFILDVAQGTNDYKNSKSKTYETRCLKDGQSFKTVCGQCNSWSGSYLVNDFKRVFDLIILSTKKANTLQERS